MSNFLILGIYCLVLHFFGGIILKLSHFLYKKITEKIILLSFYSNICIFSILFPLKKSEIGIFLAFSPCISKTLIIPSFALINNPSFQNH